MRGVRVFLFILFCLAAVCVRWAMCASDRAEQTITVTIEPFALVGLADKEWASEGRVTVDAEGVTAEGQELGWVTNLKEMRITVESNLPSEGQNYVLEACAEKIVGNGMSSGWVILNDEPAAIVSGVSVEQGGCVVKYRAAAKKEGDGGADEHIVIYTITE